MLCSVSRDGVVSELGVYCFVIEAMLCSDCVQRRCGVRVRGCTVLSMKQCLFLLAVL